MRLVSLSLLIAVLATGCLNPLAMRRARVLEQGKTEILVTPEVGALAIEGSSLPIGAPGVSTNILTPAWPAVTASVRHGVFENTDVQLKLDTGFIPEAHVAYQLVGDPKANELALTVVGGLKGWYGDGDETSGGVIFVPVQLLADMPLGDHALFAGVRATPHTSFLVGKSPGFSLNVIPGVTAGASFQFGNFVLQPEIGYDHYIALVGPAAADGVNPLFGNLAVGLGFGARF